MFMTFDFWIIMFVLCAGMFVSVRTGKLTIEAALTGGLLGLLIFLGAGFTGIAMIAAFFVLGTAASSCKMRLKEGLGVAEENKGRRTAAQVIANAGMAGIMGLLTWFYPTAETLLRLMMAASLASATGDTLSSELGNVYGRKFINVVTLKKDKRGLNGVVSLEGTLFGIAGSAFIGSIYAVGFKWDRNFYWIVIAGIVGNLSDSILGATLERKNYLNNNVVNFLNTFVAALAVMGMYAIASK